jgi:hypothetical protein
VRKGLLIQASKKATGLELIEVPRSRVQVCLARVVIVDLGGEELKHALCRPGRRRKERCPAEGPARARE